MVHFTLVKGEIDRIIDQDTLCSKSIWVITLAQNQLKARVGCCGFNGRITRVFSTSWQSNETAVFTTLVTGVNTF
jgi:hypothetical protein